MTTEHDPLIWMDDLLRNDLSPDDAKSLSAWLDEDRAHRDSFREYVLMNHVLVLHYKSLEDRSVSPEDEIPVSDEEVIRWEHSVKAVRDVVVPDEEGETGKESRPGLWARWFLNGSDLSAATVPDVKSNVGFVIRLILFAGAVIALCFHENVRNRTDDQFEPLATIQETINAKWKPGAEHFARGQRIGSTRLDLESGWVKLRYNNGAELLLEGPGSYQVNGGMNLFSSQGRISSNIPVTARGFEVVTPFARFVDLGTEFFVAVDDKQADLEVVSGTVILARSKEYPGKIMTGGRESSVNSLQQLVEKPIQKSRYINTEVFSERLAQHLVTWRKQEEERHIKLDNDPNLMVRFLFDSTDKRIRNRSARGQSLGVTANLEQTGQAEGPVSGSTAIDFRRNDSRVRFGFSPRLSSMTLTTRVRVDHLRPGGNILFSSGKFLEEKGAFLWQLLGDGSLQCQITTNDQGNVECYASGSVIARKHWNTWHDLACVFDAKSATISFYANGRLVSSLPWREPIRLVADQVALGNIEKQTNNTSRYLQGAMSEFCIYGDAVPVLTD